MFNCTPNLPEISLGTVSSIDLLIIIIACPAVIPQRNLPMQIMYKLSTIVRAAPIIASNYVKMAAFLLPIVIVLPPTRDPIVIPRTADVVMIVLYNFAWLLSH